ncbi:MAG: ABC transporter substrate-binding protein [Candidatus Izemoplasmatales bacterium]|nr:ABC transporter substrate-binding protein [Candidatus Izemoplasmatales bacterium]
MKKFCLALVMVLSVFAFMGCDNKEDDVFTIEYYYIMSGTFVPTDLAKVQDEINEILIEKIDAKVNLHPISAWSYDERLNIIINASDYFDICYTSSWTNNYFRNVSKEAYYDITDIVAEYAPNLYQAIDPLIYDSITIDERLYGVINLQVLPRTAGYTVEKESWDAYCLETGFSADMVQDYTDIEGYLAYVLENDPDAYNILVPFDPAGIVIGLGFDNIYGMQYPGSISVTDDPSDGITVVNQFATDDYRDLFRTAVEWYEKGYINEDVLTEAADYTLAYSWMMSTWKPGAEAEEFKRSGNREMLCIPFSDSVMYNNWTGSNINAISTNSKNPEKCLEFLDLLYTDKELYNMLVFGLEGDHYTKDATRENYITAVENTNYSFADVGWQFSNQFNSYLTEYQDENVWEDTKTINENAEFSPIMGFVFDYSEVELELANCYTVYNEYINSLLYGIFGTGFETQYNKFLQKLEIAGVNSILEEMQNQLDAWLASK